MRRTESFYMEALPRLTHAPPAHEAERIAARRAAEGHDDHRARARQLVVATPRLHPQHAPAGTQVFQPAPSCCQSGKWLSQQVLVGQKVGSDMKGVWMCHDPNIVISVKQASQPDLAHAATAERCLHALDLKSTHPITLASNRWPACTASAQPPRTASRASSSRSASNCVQYSPAKVHY